MTFWLAALLAAALLGGGVSSALAAGDANDANRPFDMSASDVGMDITRLLLDKPEVPVTVPKGDTKPVERAPLPAEGTMVVDRLARLSAEPKSRWLVVTFEPEPKRRNESPRRLLPCRLMEQMETLALREPGTRFKISGETTIFEEHAYLLLTKVTALSPDVLAPSATAAPAPKPIMPLEAVPAPATQPAAAAKGPKGEPTSDDLLRDLLSEKVGRPVQAVPVRTTAPPARSVAPVGENVLPVERGEMVSDRLVRILPDPQGEWWVASFEADNTLQEPPLRLLPCGMLARAERLVGEARASRMRVFRISGKVTRYEGRRYLLLRKVLIERNLDQF